MFGVFVGMFMLFIRYNHGLELFPDIDPNVAQVVIEAPSGTRIELTDAYTRTCEEATAGIGDLVAYSASVGVSVNGMGNGDSAPSNKSVVMMEFVDKVERSRSSAAALEDLRGKLEGFTGATVTVEKREEGPPTGKPVNIEISGRDFDVLGQLAKEVREEIRGLPGLVNIVDNYDNELPEIRVRADVEKAARYGLRTFDIAGTIRTALHGSEVAKYRVGEDEYDITVRYQDSFRRKVEDLENATVFYEGEAVPVSAFATPEFTTSLASISRIDGQRVVTVSADLAAGYNGNALLAQVQDLLSDLSLPAGYQVAYTGESEDQEEAQAFLSDAYAVAIMLILLVLISQFGSVTQPADHHLQRAALAHRRAGGGLLVTGTPFGIIMTGVGVISLAGIVVNNAIVLIDYMNQLRERGMGLEEAILQGGMTRFRPVVLTAITTILGLIPLTTGFSLDFGEAVRRRGGPLRGHRRRVQPVVGTHGRGGDLGPGGGHVPDPHRGAGDVRVDGAAEKSLRPDPDRGRNRRLTTLV